MDIPQRDEPEQTALLMRCCSSSSIAARLVRSRRRLRAASNATTSHPPSWRRPPASPHAAQQSRFGYQKLMFPAHRKTLNTLLIRQQPKRAARRRASAPFDRSMPSSP
ncbi:hypothetical protein [Burkholderia anthina]|uniref:hypothetical protein n=1 Tax=Burkholderia anthina TaxID=179879 RepID=UPI0015894A4B